MMYIYSSEKMTRFPRPLGKLPTGGWDIVGRIALASEQGDEQREGSRGEEDGVKLGEADWVR